MIDASAGLYRRESCPGCDTWSGDPVYRLAYADPGLKKFLDDFYQYRVVYEWLMEHSFEINKCPNCGLLFQAYVLNQAGQAALYGEWVNNQKSLQKKQQAKTKLFQQYAGQLDTLSRIFHRPPHQVDILEFGMGWGYWSRMAMAFGFHVQGFELSPERVDHARGLGIEVIEKLPEAGPRYDFIYANQVFEHLELPLQTLTDLKARLKPDGVIYLRVPDGRGVESSLKQNGWQVELDAIHPLEHINCFTRKSLCAMASKAGLRVLQPPLRIDLSKFWGGLKREINDRWMTTHVFFRKQ